MVPSSAPEFARDGAFPVAYVQVTLRQKSVDRNDRVFSRRCGAYAMRNGVVPDPSRNFSRRACPEDTITQQSLTQHERRRAQYSCAILHGSGSATRRHEPVPALGCAVAKRVKR